MKKAILGKKIGMTQLFRADGTMIPVTVIEAGPCPVVQLKTKGNDGYEAVQMGFCEAREKLISKPEKGHCAKANVKPLRYLREFRLEDCGSYSVGQVVKADVFAEGDQENITVQNLEVVRVDAERNLLLVKGAVPGAKGGVVAVKSTVK